MNNQENDQKHHTLNQQSDLTQQQQQHHPQDQEINQHHIQDQENNHQHNIQDQENDQNQNQELQQQEQEQETQQQQEKHNYTTSSSTPFPMSYSSPPSKPPPQPPLQPLQQNQPFDSSPPLDSSHSSYGYVFSPPEALNQSSSPPQDQTTSYSYVYSPSSPDIKPAKAPISPSPPPLHVPSKVGSKTQDQEHGGGGGSKKRRTPVLGRNKEVLNKKALLGCRILGFICCLVSFSIMAADKDQGWAIDSFYSYKEFRYCMSVNVIGFVYSGLQLYSLAHSLATGKYITANIRCLVDFSLDQILTYLLLSASSSAAFRVEDWESNWGKDKFPSMAKSSVILSFLAFVAFVLCSLLSGQIHFTSNAT